MPTGTERIATERQRQIDDENWTPEHDDDHFNQSLAKAAACYAAPSLVYTYIHGKQGASIKELWPWEEKWDKRVGRSPYAKPAHNADELDARIRDLEKAGALCAAEIDRLLRKKDKGGLWASPAA